ncbi:cellulose biosynthesis protein BcsG [Marinobacterium marinum]|uniref:Cellulose biosynthesis protein BcsG n=1 Tax=Marinobacterium marinum TaxID=2756129 RepID=A0A7W1WVA9_9GAMM|nr:cellulose biosynthesis protein BcsG [Marinobacterium marinum]MBA4500837.1 cellulose biosynthesis protein BcsG [Marinobacterium marinum]
MRSEGSVGGSLSRVSEIGLGHWNLYFLCKLGMFWLGYLNLQPLPNIVFAAFLLLPLPWTWLRHARLLIAVPLAIALLYQDSWWPPITRLLNQPGVMDFSGKYLLELAGRFVNWTLCALLLAFVVFYIYLRHWLRFTTFTLLGLGWFSLQPLLSLAPTMAQGSGEQVMAETGKPQDTKMSLDESLQAFYDAEQRRVTQFPPADEAGAPFDLLIINVCSMAWDDLDAVGLKDNPLFSQMDVVFERFNSATSYSGPAAVRLLRASCGQSSHQGLYEDNVPQQCLLMDRLRGLGFNTELAMNHNGHYDNFLGDLQTQGGLGNPVVDEHGLSRNILGFDNSPIWRDREVLGAWWQRRQQSDHQASTALFYNTTTLHDGNRIVTGDGGTRLTDYRELAQRLLQDLDAFFQQLEQSGRPVAVLLVPEHGANLHGDRMQIQGMRELPSPAITHVPVGIKLFGMGAQTESPHLVTEPSSYLALSEFVSRLYAQSTETGTLSVDLPHLLADLPVTPWVAENAGTVVLEHEGIPYIRLEEQGTWLPYPARFK